MKKIRVGQIWKAIDIPPEWEGWGEAPYQIGDKFVISKYFPYGEHFMNQDAIQLIGSSGRTMIFGSKYVRKHFRSLDA